MTITTVHVKEIGMVAPDMLYVRVRDQEIVQGSLVELSSPDAGTIWTNVQRTNPANGQTEWCKIGGMRNGTAKMFQHFYATMPTAYLDRTVVDDISKWASIGGRTVTAVYRKTKPFDQGIAFPNSLGFEVHCVTMEHELFVKLSGNLAQGGPYTVSVTGNTFPATAFTFNDRVTRCPAIRTSLSGHRPGELNKKARLQIWIPGYGTEGRVNYASTYSVSSFDVIDAANATVFTGPASLLYAPTDADEMGVAAQDYPSTTVAPKVATGATRANPCQITVPSHGYTTGQKKAFFGFGDTSGSFFNADPNGFHGAVYTITVTGANTFTIPLNTSAVANAYQAGVFSAGYDSLVRDVVTANYSNTYVYELDFSTFNPATYQGYFRIRIPGIGVSDAFLIEDDVYWTNLTRHVQGYYNQLTGVALDSAVGGWTREKNYRDGYNGQVMYESMCPACFAYEAVVPGLVGVYSIPSLTTTDATWGTTNRVTDGFVTIRDAGDWDWHLSNEGLLTYFILELGYRQLPAAVRNFQINFPKASVLDPTLYAGTDSLGAQFHMAVYQLDNFRKFQKGDGRVYGGVSYTEDDSGAAGREYLFFPSQVSTSTAYLLAADPYSNLYYAACAAKMAQVLKENGFTSAGSTWQASAIAAYNWSESLYQDYVANGATGSVIQAYFNTTLGFQTKSGFSNGTFASAMAAMFGAQYSALRIWANATLYNLTDSATYGNVVAAQFVLANDDLAGHAAWEFCQAPSATGYTSPQPQVAYYTAGWANPPDNAVIVDQVFYRAIWKFLTTTKNFSNTSLKNMQNIVADHTGRNQLGMSRTVGIGAADRAPQTALIRDREAMNLQGSAVLGATIYCLTGTAGGGFFNFSSDSPINYTVEAPTGLFESSMGSKRIITPPHASVPRVEAHYENTNNVTMNEFVPSQTIIPEFCRTAHMHCWDGNTQTTAPIRRVRRTLTAAP